MYSVVDHFTSWVLRPAHIRKGRIFFPRHLLRGLCIGLCIRFSCGDCAPLTITKFGVNAAQGMAMYGVHVFAFLAWSLGASAISYSVTSPVLLIWD